MSKSVETLKQAGKIVSGLIGQRTPPVFETCRSAYTALGQLTEYALARKSIDESVPTFFAAQMNEIITKLEPFRAPLGGAAGVKTKMSDDEFAAYFKEQVEKGMEEAPGIGLRRLYALNNEIEKAVLGFTSEPGIEIETYVDPWQQASVEREGDGPAKVTSGRANAGEVKATPGISVDDIMKSVASSVEVTTKGAREINVGWTTDLTSPEFLQGERKIDFGPDGK
jgi:hypothetical protein